MGKVALITGICGQDGKYLAESLLADGYEVHGLYRRDFDPPLPADLADKVELHNGDLTVEEPLLYCMNWVRPDEIYNLAGQSSPALSWKIPVLTGEVNALGAHRLFDIARDMVPDARIFQACSIEFFQSTDAVINEKSPVDPQTPYAVSKLYSLGIAKVYRHAFNQFIACGLMFNHESPHRSLSFVTQKVAFAAACAELNIRNSDELGEDGRPIVSEGKVRLGNLDSCRDWGYAPDFVRAMRLIINHSSPQDWVIGTGKLHSVRQLCQAAYESVGKNWQDYVATDPALLRPADPQTPIADITNIKENLGWSPTKDFNTMISEMVQAWIKRLSQEYN